MSRLLPFVVLLAALFLFASAVTAQTCSGGAGTIQALQARITADQESIKRLGAGLSSADLEEWANAAEKQREEIVNRSLKAAISNLADYVLALPENAQDPMSIGGYKLPNGLGSIGTGQRNAIVARLRQQGGINQALIPAIDALSKISDKRGSLEYMEQLANVAGILKQTAEMGAEDTTVGQTEAAFELAATLAKMAGKDIEVPVKVGNALFNGGSDLFNLFWMSRSVNSLVNSSEAQLKALEALNRQLHNDVQALQNCRNPDRDKKEQPKPEKAKPDTNQPTTEIVEPDMGISELKKMPMINPDFIAALQCDAAGLQSLLMGGNGVSNVPACPRCRAGDPCNRYADGSYIPAFISPELADDSRDPSAESLRKATSRAQQQTDALNRDVTEVQSQADTLQRGVTQAQNEVNSAQNTIAAARDQQSLPRASLPRPRIPAGWVPCTCPDKHPHAGLLVGATRYHSGELHCDRYF